jgi:hypothetical protein
VEGGKEGIYVCVCAYIFIVGKKEEERKIWERERKKCVDGWKGKYIYLYISIYIYIFIRRKKKKRKNDVGKGEKKVLGEKKNKDLCKAPLCNHWHL